MRARGANALMALGFEGPYGVPPAAGTFFRAPFVSANLGDEQGLVASDILGNGRDPQQPSRDAVDNVGDVVVPLCARNIGLWLRLLLGSPTTVQGVAARGTLTFTAQPAANATISVGGQGFTFVSTAPAADEIRIGATLIETVANAVRALNASTVPGVAAATYRADPKGVTIEIVHDALGVVGNSFALAVGTTPAPNATASGATLAGGAATGAYQHTFIGGAQTLPSAAIQIGMPEVPSFRMNAGAKANTFGVQLQRSGNLNATINLIAQGETSAISSQAGSETELAVARFSNFSGIVRRRGVPIADLVAGALNFSNGLDPVPAIGRGDGRISGVDEGMLSCTGTVGIRFSSDEYQLLAENGEASEFEYGWVIPASVHALRWIVHEVYLPKAKTPITGPTGVQADYQWQAAESPTLGRTITVVLTNDVASYA